MLIFIFSAISSFAFDSSSLSHDSFNFPLNLIILYWFFNKGNKESFHSFPNEFILIKSNYIYSLLGKRISLYLILYLILFLKHLLFFFYKIFKFSNLSLFTFARSCSTDILDISFSILFNSFLVVSSFSLS